MAFKMTQGMKGNPASKRIQDLGACVGPAQQPCPPRLQQEETTELVADRSSTSRYKYIKSKKKAAVDSGVEIELEKVELKKKLKANRKKANHLKGVA